MTNEEWLRTLSKCQKQRYKKSGKIPDFCIYRIYNSVTHSWVFPSILSVSPEEAMNMMFQEAGKNAYKWRYKIKAFVRLDLNKKVWRICYNTENAMNFNKEKFHHYKVQLESELSEWLEREREEEP